MAPNPSGTSKPPGFSAHAERLVTILERGIETINLVKAFPSLWLDVFQGRTGQVEHFLGPLSTMHLIHLGKLGGFDTSHGHQGDYQRETRAWKYCPEEQQQQRHNTTSSSWSKSTLESPPPPPADHYYHHKENEEEQEQDPWIFIEPKKKLLVTKLMDAHPSDFCFLTDLLGLHVGGGNGKTPPFSLVKLLKEALKSRYGDHVKKALVDKDVKSLSCILSLISSSSVSSEIRTTDEPRAMATTTEQQQQHLTWLMDQMWQKRQHHHHQSLNRRIQKVDSKCGKQSENGEMYKPDSTFSVLPQGSRPRRTRMIIKRLESDHTITNTPPQCQPTLSRQSIGDNSIWEMHQQQPDQQNATHYSPWPKQPSHPQEPDDQEEQDSFHNASLDSEILAILNQHDNQQKQKPDPTDDANLSAGLIQAAAEQQNNSLDNLQSNIFDSSTSSEEKSDWKSQKQDTYSQQNSLTTRRPTLADLPITSISSEATLPSPTTTTKESSLVSPSSCDETIQSVDLSEAEKQQVTKMFSLLLPAIRNNGQLKAWLLKRDSLQNRIVSDVDHQEQTFEGLEDFQSILEELVELINAKLQVTLTNEMRTANYLRESWKRLFRRTRELERLKRGHIEMKKAARPRLLSLDFQVKLLQSRLSQVSQVNHELVKKEIRETELVAAIQEKAQVLRRESAFRSLQLVQRQSKDLKAENQERQKQLLTHRNALYEQLRQQISTYDQRMFVMQQKLDDTIQERRQGAKNLERCQLEYETIQNKYTDMMAEKKLRQILRNAQAASEMKRNKAASVIQATWRKYRIRKRKQERKRAKKTAAAAKRKQAKAAKK